MFVLLLLGKLSPRSRSIAGMVCTVAGLLWIAAFAVIAPDLIIHGIVLAAVGVILYGSAMLSRRRARQAAASSGDELAPAAQPEGR